MAKQSLKQKETEVSTDNGIGKQIERTFTVDDLALPSPTELEAYAKVNPEIVNFLLDTARKEQEHRHQLDAEKMKVISCADKRASKINILGMVLAFCSLLVMMAVAAFMLYLDHPWFASFFGGASLVTVISIFVNNGTRKLDQNGERTK